VTRYRQEEIEKLIISFLSHEGFELKVEPVLDERIRWRPPIFAEKNHVELAIDIRLNDSITDFWISIYKKTASIISGIKILIAIPEDVTIPYTLGRKLEENNIGIMSVSYEGVQTILEPRSLSERKTTKAIRKILDPKIDKASYKHLEPYVNEITAAVNIYEIGCPREAIGVIGRVLETSINNFLIEANRRHKIALCEAKRKSMDFHARIGFLATAKNASGGKKKPVITQSEQSKMLSVKWDRNIGDHPSTEEEIRQMVRDSRAVFQIGISMIELMKKKNDEL
jgi:hypothetical protein